MMRKAILLLALLPALAACGETPIKKANCWNSMAFVEPRDCASAP